MVCIPLAILRDILQVCPNPEEQLIVTQTGKFFVIHNYRERKFATQFEGNGLMHIYMLDDDPVNDKKLSCLNSKQSKVFDTHFLMENTRRGYIRTLDSFFVA